MLGDVYVVFQGRVLKDNLTLAEQGVEENSFLRVNIRLRGGGPSRKGGQPECYAL